MREKEPTPILFTRVDGDKVRLDAFVRADGSFAWA